MASQFPAEISPPVRDLNILSKKVVANISLIAGDESAIEPEFGMEHNVFLTESISNLAMSAHPDVCMSSHAVSLTSSCFVIVISRF